MLRPMPRSVGPKSTATRPLEALLVYKKSKLSLYVQEKRNKRIGQLVEEGASIVENLRPAHEAHKATLEHVKRTLQEAGVSYRTCYRPRLKPEETEGRLIITVGGDGTVLDASHKITRAHVLGVNSDPERSVGFLCAATKETFPALLADVLAGRLLPTDVRRLHGTLDEGASGPQPLPFPVLNEILVAHRNPAATVRYRIEARGHAEAHKSSGVWIAAPAGSTAAIASAGGRIQPVDDERWQLRVREPYLADLESEELLDLMLEPDERVRLTSKMPQGVIYLDGPHVRLPFPVGAVLEVTGAGPPLSLYVTEAMRERRRSLGLRLSQWANGA